MLKLFIATVAKALLRLSFNYCARDIHQTTMGGLFRSSSLPFGGTLSLVVELARDLVIKKYHELHKAEPGL